MNIMKLLFPNTYGKKKGNIEPVNPIKNLNISDINEKLRKAMEEKKKK